MYLSEIRDNHAIVYCWCWSNDKDYVKIGKSRVNAFYSSVISPSTRYSPHGLILLGVEVYGTDKEAYNREAELLKRFNRVKDREWVLFDSNVQSWLDSCLAPQSHGFWWEHDKLIQGDILKRKVEKHKKEKAKADQIKREQEAQGQKRREKEERIRRDQQAKAEKKKRKEEQIRRKEEAKAEAWKIKKAETRERERKKHLEYQRRRYRDDPDYRERQREYQREYNQRTDVKERKRQRDRRQRAKTRKKRPSTPHTLDLF